MKFSYTALNEQNEELSGILEADTLETAKDQLHKMGVSILVINPASEEEATEEGQKKEVQEKPKEGIITFNFTAKDPKGKEINGTIDAKEDYGAYKRLVSEYHFDVQKLVPLNANKEDEELAEERLKLFREQLKTEVKKDDREEKEWKEEEEKKKQIVTEEVDKIIELTHKKVLEEFRHLFSIKSIQKVEEALKELERIRTSNNLKHINEVSHRLYDLLSHPDEANAENQNAYEIAIQPLKENKVLGKDLAENPFESKQFKLLISKIKNQLNKLGLGKLIEKLKGGSGSENKEEGGKWKKLISGLQKKPQIPSFKMPAVKTGSFSDSAKEEVDKIKKWFKKEKPEEVTQSSEPTETEISTPIMDKPEETKPIKEGRDFSEFFVEVDSFVGWLLFFYISYFFLSSFSLEKGVGLPTNFVLKTFQSPLIIQIGIFLLFAHFLLRIKTIHFQRNLMGSLVLFLFGFGTCALVILNL